MDKNITYRIFEMQDYEKVYKLWKIVLPNSTDSSYDREQVERFMERNPGTSFVAELDGKIIGAVLAGNDGRRGYIHHLGVYIEHRNSGIGKILVQSVENAFSKIGIEKVHLFVFKDNTTAKAFYNKVGYLCREDLDICSKSIR